jgi:hypothetical protein
MLKSTKTHAACPHRVQHTACAAHAVRHTARRRAAYAILTGPLCAPPIARPIALIACPGAAGAPPVAPGPPYCTAHCAYCDWRRSGV